MLKQRALAAVLLIAGFLLALFWAPSWLWLGLIGTALGIAGWEWARIAGYGPRVQWAYLAGLLALYLGWHALVANGGVAWSWLWGVALAFWFGLVPLWLARHWVVGRHWVLLLAGAAVLLPTALAMLWLRDRGALLLLLVMSLAWVADIAAYFVGRAWGTHKLAPRISPGKTWEGAVGALIAGGAYVIVWDTLAVVSPLSSVAMPKIGLGFAAAALVAISIVGDLFESHMKRCAGMKDSGDLIPGHGGILDRIDSQTSMLPVACAGLHFLR